MILGLLKNVYTFLGILTVSKVMAHFLFRFVFIIYCAYRIFPFFAANLFV